MALLINYSDIAHVCWPLTRRLQQRNRFHCLACRRLPLPLATPLQILLTDFSPPLRWLMALFIFCQFAKLPSNQCYLGVAPLKA
jgi:hypothetical protein